MELEASHLDFPKNLFSSRLMSRLCICSARATYAKSSASSLASASGSLCDEPGLPSSAWGESNNSEHCASQRESRLTTFSCSSSSRTLSSSWLICLGGRQDISSCKLAADILLLSVLLYKASDTLASSVLWQSHVPFVSVSRAYTPSLLGCNSCTPCLALSHCHLARHERLIRSGLCVTLHLTGVVCD